MKQLELKVGVKSLLINEEKEVLLVKRSSFPEGIWEIPGGRIDSHETLEEALKRELEEEVEIKSLDIIGILGAQDIFPEGGESHVVRITYISRVTSNLVTLSSEHSEFVWVKLDDIVKQTPIDPYLEAFLKDKRTFNYIKDTIDRE